MLRESGETAPHRAQEDRNTLLLLLLLDLLEDSRTTAELQLDPSHSQHSQNPNHRVRAGITC